MATLSSTDEYVQFTDDTEAYGTVLGNEGTAYSADAFAFDMAGNTPDGRFVTFDLTVNGVEKEVWESHFSIQVHAPNINQLAIVIDDATGNMNGILDTGDVIDGMGAEAAASAMASMSAS